MGERDVYLLHHPYPLIREPSGCLGAFIIEIYHIIVTFDLKNRVFGIGIFLLKSVLYRGERDNTLMIIIIFATAREKESQTGYTCE